MIVEPHATFISYLVINIGAGKIVWRKGTVYIVFDLGMDATYPPFPFPWLWDRPRIRHLGQLDWFGTNCS